MKRLLLILAALCSLAFPTAAAAYIDNGWGGGCGPDTVGVTFEEPWYTGTLIRYCYQDSDGNYQDPVIGYRP